MSAKLPIEFYCTRWGSENIPWNVFMDLVKSQGFDGIEYGIPHTTTVKTLDEVWNLAHKQGLKVIPHHFDTVTTDFFAHQEQFEAWFDLISDYDAEKINVQTGRDCFDWQLNMKLFEFTESFQKSNNITVVHETHRQRCLFAAHVAKSCLEKMPNLKLTLDISHWICVAESYLSDQHQAVDLAIQKSEHIHARIGHTQGSQVNDPRAPEWQSVVDIHLNWWKAVAEKLTLDKKVLTVTPEFGPAPYMPVHPYSTQPCSNQWDINVHMMNLLRQAL